MNDDELSKCLTKKMNFLTFRIVIVFIFLIPAIICFIYFGNLIGLKSDIWFDVFVIGYLFFLIYCVLSANFMKCTKCNNFFYLRNPIKSLSWSQYDSEQLLGQKCKICGLEIKRSIKN